MVIEPGDLVIGDDDGLLCVPYDQIADVYAGATAKHAAESAQMEKIAQGTNDRSWVLESLKKKGCLLPG
ncbi:4-hydroxy-4-methyl-2-oxoglutarate aldolase [compost metagenome]